MKIGNQLKLVFTLNPCTGNWSYLSNSLKIERTYKNITLSNKMKIY